MGLIARVISTTGSEPVISIFMIAIRFDHCDIRGVQPTAVCSHAATQFPQIRLLGHYNNRCPSCDAKPFGGRSKAVCLARIIAV